MSRAPIFTISRLRMGTDGHGVTTLVAFMGCPLKCKYCLNEKCHEPIYEDDGKTLRNGIMLLTPSELYDLVKIDNIYFQATDGGICFGGGEPTLYLEFIEEFCDLCNEKWKITIETSLRCSGETIRKLSKAIDYWIVDVKSLDSDTYSSYTRVSSMIEQHLTILKRCVTDKQATIKVPIIPGFNNESEADRTAEDIKKRFRFTNVVKIRYITKYCCPTKID